MGDGRRWRQPVRSAAVGVWLGLGVGAWTGLVGAAPARAELRAQVVNGVPELAEPTAAALVQGDAATGLIACSATLIGCDSAVTAAHCLNAYADQRTTLFFQHAGFVAIESAAQHPAYVEALESRPTGWLDVLRVEDIAFLKLAAPVSGIAPASLVAGPAPAPGTPGRIVGFGRDPLTEASHFDRNAGIKRSGSIELTPCTGELSGFDVLCWEPGLDGEPGEDVSTCNVDSGGPLFVTEHGARVVAGLTKGAVYDSEGQPGSCLPPVYPFDTNLARHRAWIESMVAAMGATPPEEKRCGNLPALPDDAIPQPCNGTTWGEAEGARTCGFTGELGAAEEIQYVFEVPLETVLLRVALNGIASQSGEIDTNFYVRSGGPASSVLHDCGAGGAGNLGFCELSAPAAGPWYVQVEQASGAGSYQVTVSLFAPGAVPVPALSPAARGALLALLAAAGWSAGVLRRGGTTAGRSRERPAR